MRTIGKYEVVEKIGDGGFGTVFKGFDPHIRRFVAIKSCTSEEQELRNRFFHEAQIAGNLQHRNIVTVYDFGLQDEVPYLVQEYLTGEDLDRKVKRKDSIPLPDKLLFLMQVLRGLDYAHSKGITHRDIKPANIRILEDGTAKIMDFGIAKIADQDTGLTQTGMTLGTAAYLAPEQIRGEPVGPGTDIFSWGVTAWELLSYQRPFTGQHISTVLYQILHEPAPSLQTVAPEVPGEIVAVVEKCLEKKPERRYSRCVDVLRDLEEAIHGKRLFAQSGLATLVAASRAETADTRAIPTPAPGGLSTPRAAGAGATDPITARVTTMSGEVGELELEADGRTPHSISATQALRGHGFRWSAWAAAVVAAVLLAGGGWWLARQSARERHAAANTAQEPASASVGGGVTLAAAKGTGPVLATPAIEPHPVPTAAAPVAPPPAPAPSAAPTLAPPPKPSYVVVPAAWSGDVSVSVNKQRRALGAEQRFKVDAGKAKLSFAIDTPGYRKTIERTVDVAQGATVHVEVPIEPPGEIQVQPKIGTPSGRVTLDGEQVAGTIVHRTVGPGSHLLHIEPAAPGTAPIEQPVEVPAGKRLVVTFDLTAGTLVPVVSARG